MPLSYSHKGSFHNVMSLPGVLPVFMAKWCCMGPTGTKSGRMPCRRDVPQQTRLRKRPRAQTKLTRKSHSRLQGRLHTTCRAQQPILPFAASNALWPALKLAGCWEQVCSAAIA